jgi:hypothetical protein
MLERWKRPKSRSKDRSETFLALKLYSYIGKSLSSGMTIEQKEKLKDLGIVPKTKK